MVMPYSRAGNSLATATTRPAMRTLRRGSCRFPFRFERGHLAQATKVTRGGAVFRGEECLHEVPGHFRTDRAAAHAQDVHVIVLNALLRREMIVNQTGANAFHLVGANGGADAAAADRH